ncbi:MAG: hypothetical protein HYZ38_03945 [Mycobacterium sp.]|nr:hypothetical protein [Mycobacterium sp.]
MGGEDIASASAVFVIVPDRRVEADDGGFDLVGALQDLLIVAVGPDPRAVVRSLFS